MAMSRFRSPLAYAIALFALLCGLLLRWLVNAWLGDEFPFVTLFGAVAVAVWAGGYRPAILVALLGYQASSYLFIEPRYQWLRLDAQNLVGLLSYAFTCGVIIVIGQAMRSAQSRSAARRPADAARGSGPQRSDVQAPEHQWRATTSSPLALA